MTIAEFNRTRWTANMKATYHGDKQTYPVLSVDFGEQLIGLNGAGGVEGEIYWARCENVTLNAPDDPSSANRPDSAGGAQGGRSMNQNAGTESDGPVRKPKPANEMD